MQAAVHAVVQTVVQAAVQAAVQAGKQAGRTQQNMHGRGLKKPITEGLERMAAYHQDASITCQGSTSPRAAAWWGVGLGTSVRSVPHLQQSVEQQYGQVLALIGSSRVQTG